MRSILSFLLSTMKTSLLLAFACVLMPAAMHADTTNLLTNPGAETGTLSGWSVIVSPGVDTGTLVPASTHTPEVTTSTQMARPV
jgi:hypothetical protein